MMKSFFIKNVVAVAAYSRLASRSQSKFHTMKLSPLHDPCAAAPAQSTTFANLHFDFRLARERTWVQFTHCTSGLPRRLSNTKIEDSCGFLWSSSAALRLKFGQVGSVWNRLFTSLSSIRAWTKWRSDHVTGRLQLNLSQVSWVLDNHLRCQQCRLNEGQPLCTQDSPCLVCKDWLPEAWAAQAKANARKTRRKAAAAG